MYYIRMYDGIVIRFKHLEKYFHMYALQVPSHFQMTIFFESKNEY